MSFVVATDTESASKSGDTGVTRLLSRTNDSVPWWVASQTFGVTLPMPKV